MRILVCLILISMYFYAEHKLVTLWIAGYNKFKLIFYGLALLLVIIIMCYTIYVRLYILFLMLLIVLINSLIYSYNKTKK